jgi:hypothetical protein
MKIPRLILLLMIPLFLHSCQKDDGPYIKIKTIENLIYQEIRDFRIDQGDEGAFVHQYLIVTEAQAYSYKMANNVVEADTGGLDVHWDALQEKFSFYNLHAVVLKSASSDENVILEELLELTGGEAALLEDVTQCGVGVESDSEGNNYITVLLAKADS